MTTKIGDLGEHLVSQWLQSKSYCILHHSWYCRWGEIDIIAEDKTTSTLIFVEVKTRKSFNWDNDGLEAVSEVKQQKIVRSAALFLAKNARYVDYFMRFDVALVGYQKLSRQQQLESTMNNYVIENNDCQTTLSEPLFSYTKDGYYLTIKQYLSDAFEALHI